MFPKVFVVNEGDRFEPINLVALDEAGERRVKAHVVKNSLKFIAPAEEKPTLNSINVTQDQREAASISREILSALPERLRSLVNRDAAIALAQLELAVMRWEAVKLRDELASKDIQEIADTRAHDDFVVNSLVVRLDEIFDESRGFRAPPLIRELPSKLA